MGKLIFVVISLIFVQYCFSQENKTDQILQEMKKQFKSGEITIDGSTYLVDTFKMICSVSNKAINYKTPSNVDMDDPSNKTSFDSLEILTEIFKECLADKLDARAINSSDNIMLMMVSDLSGNITKVSFIYEYRFNIPIEAIAQIEKAIKEKCRLNFDKNAKAFLQAKYVEFTSTIFLKDICY